MTTSEQRLVDVQVSATCQAWLDETWHITIPAGLLADYRAGRRDLEDLVKWAQAHTVTVTVEEESRDEHDREWTGLTEPPMLDAFLNGRTPKEDPL